MQGNIFVLNVICFWIVSVTQTEKIYTIISDLEPLLLTQDSVISNLEYVIFRKKQVLDFIERELYRFTIEHDKMAEDAKSYLWNPINNLVLLKRLNTDFKFLKMLTEEDIGLETDTLLKYPSYDDLEEAVSVIIRLQDVYRLNVTQLADGLLNTSYSAGGQTYTENFLPMTSSDCFEISKILNKEQRKRKSHKMRLSWLFEALRKYSRRGVNYDFNKFDIVKAICDSYYVLDDSSNFLEWTEKLLDMKPSYNNRNLKLRINQHSTKKPLVKVDPRTTKNTKMKRKPVLDPKKEITPCVTGLNRKAFKMLCRGEVSVPSEVSKSLKCWYFTGYHPFTRLAPFKAEQLYIQPDVFLFHNVLSDDEIDTIKRISTPHLNVSESMSYRLSKGVQMDEFLSAPIGHLGQRMSDFTGLWAPVNMMAVSNYGVGGHYTTHVDSMRQIKDKKESFEFQDFLNEKDEDNIRQIIEMSRQLNRIATIIFYLSEVEQGGATVFPALGLTVYPVKGAALFWTNMLPSLDIDYATCHGACPVLRGSKWVASKWIDAENQELRKPCTAEITSRRIEDIPFPEIL